MAKEIVDRPRPIYSVHRHFTEFGPIPNSLALTLEQFLLHNYRVPGPPASHALSSFMGKRADISWHPIAACQRGIDGFVPAGQKWFYEIELSRGIAADTSNFKARENGLWASIPLDVRHDINLGKGKLVISCLGTDVTQVSITKILGALRESGATLKGVIIVTNALHSKKFISFIERVWDATLLIAPMEEASALERFPMPSESEANAASALPANPKKFVFLNDRIGKGHAHQILFYLYLLKGGLLDLGHVTMPRMDSDRIDLSFLDRLHDLWGQDELDSIGIFRSLFSFGSEHFSKGLGELPRGLPFSDPLNGGELPLPARAEAYRDSCFALIGCPNFGLSAAKQAAAFSSGAFEAMLMNRPFLLLSEPASLSELKERGYQTFDLHFDEAYDEQKDPAQRFIEVEAEMRRLIGFSWEKWKGIHQDFSAVFAHNRKVMAEKVKSFGMDFLAALNA